MSSPLPSTTPVRITAPKANGDYELFTELLIAMAGDSVHIAALNNVPRSIPELQNKTLLDLCSCEATVTSQLPFKHREHVDIMPYTMRNPKGSWKFTQADVLGNDPVLQAHYDIATCLDGIEHLTREQGERLIQRMHTVADQAILFTPLHPWLMDCNNTSPESHKSLWGPNDFPDMHALVMPVYHPSLKIGAFFVWSESVNGHSVARVQTVLSSRRIQSETV